MAHPNRLTVVETVYHRTSNDADMPSSVSSRYNRNLSTTEQPYVRITTATDKWQPIPNGWIEKAGLVVIKNLEPDDECNTLEVACQDAITWASQSGVPVQRVLVMQGESVRLQPSNVKDWLIRAPKGNCRFSAHVYPD